MIEYDVLIGGKSMLDEYGLKMESYNVGMPTPIMQLVEVTGTSNIVDLTELFGDVQYEQRPLNIVLSTEAGYAAWQALLSEVAGYLHGQRMQIIFGTDVAFYYDARIAINYDKSDIVFGTIVLNGTTMPYKKEVENADGLWLWDPFSFVDGIIRNYADITSPDSVTIIGRREKVVPIFTCSAAMTVTYDSVTYNLASGVNAVYALALGEGEHVLTFAGAGTVSVAYRGGAL